MERPLRKLLAKILMAVSLLTLNACTMTHTPIGNPENPYPHKEKAEVGDIYHLPTGIKVTAGQMLTNITAARVVFVGETHDNPAAHRLELQVLEAMNQRYPKQVSLGMEMFNTDQQGVLDRWVAGELDEKNFLKESKWFENWRMDFAYYRDILVYAREHRIPVIGLNAPQELVKAVSAQPIEQLDEDLRARLPEMDLEEPYQRAMTEAVFAGHGAGNSMIDGFHRVQTLWEEMMAENTVKELLTKGQEHRMVVIAGGNHVRYGFGIPRRVYRRLPVSYSMVGVYEVRVPEEKQDRFMDVELPSFPMVPYDYVNYVEYETLPGERVKLGVRFKEDGGRILIESTVSGSSADLGGIMAGDYLEFINDRPVKDSFDLIYEVSQHQLGDQIDVIIDRNGVPMSLQIKFTPLPLPEKHGQ